MATVLTVSREGEWDPYLFVMVPRSLLMCKQLGHFSRLALMFLIAQVDYGPITAEVMDSALNIHRTTRVRCLTELKEKGFVKGDKGHIILCDPIPILTKLWDERCSAEKELGEIVGRYRPVVRKESAPAVAIEQRDYMQEAADSWNRYRPKDYSKIRRISSELVKAVDMHMRHLKLKAHDYDQFFSVLKAGVEKHDFWSKQNRSKTLQSITGIGASSDIKRGNVYMLFELGFEAPAAEVTEDHDTVVYPAAYRNLIDEYSYAQHEYSQARRNRRPTEGPGQYVARTEEDLKRAGLDPLRFKFKFGITDWPTDTPEPGKERVEDWIYDDEVRSGR